MSQARKQLRKMAILTLQSQAESEGHKVNVRSGLEMSANDWRQKQIIRMSENYDLDSEDKARRKVSEKAFAVEKRILDYLVRNGNVLVRLQRGNVLNLARLAAAHLQTGNLLLEVPMCLEVNATLERGVPCETAESHPWNRWNEFRSYNNYNQHIALALELTEEVPTAEELKRWCGEPIAYIIVPVYIMTHRGFDWYRLQDKHVKVLSELLRITNKIMVKCSPKKGKMRNYAEYLDNVAKELIERQVAVKFADILYRPALPYQMELLNIKHEKYCYYQRAIEVALSDMAPHPQPEPQTLTILVVGAMKIALVETVMLALDNYNQRATLYVVDSNEHNLATMNNVLASYVQKYDVNSVCGQISSLKLPCQVDMIVAEVFGAFGDNALLPEHLFAVQKFLKPGGVCIPTRCSSFLAPIQSSKIYNKTVNFRGLYNIPHTHDAPFNTERPFVVKPLNYYQIAEPQEVFRFDFPSEDMSVIEHKMLAFESKIDSVLHGFLGSFEATLYKNICLGTRLLNSRSEPMWYSFFLPINAPQFVAGGAPIQACVWRCSDQLRMWYEWAVTKPSMSKIHNVDGGSYFIYRAGSNY